MNNKVMVKDFSSFLRNRNTEQTDGLYTGVDFRTEYLSELDSQEWWNDSSKSIILDFEGVTTIGPSWANEVFAYFTKFDNVDVDKLFKKIHMTNISNVKLGTIKMEVEDGYRGVSIDIG